MANSPSTENATHTPGPWHAQNWTRHAAATVLVDDALAVTGKRVIADCGTEADARLIAAAPDLLKLAYHIVSRLEYGPGSNPNDGLLHDARAVIAKARGA